MDAQQRQEGSEETLAPHVRVAKASLRYTFSRSSGPGGQAVNKVNSRAQLRVAVEAIDGLDDAARERLRSMAGGRLTEAGELLFDSDEHRSQAANRRACLQRLRALVGRAMIEPRVRKKRRPSRAMIEKRLQAKRRRAEKKARRAWKREE